MRREASPVSFLMCPFCVRAPSSDLTTTPLFLWTSVFGDGEALTSDSIVRFRERAEVETSSSSMDTKCTTSATRRTVPTGNSASSRADRSKPSLARIRGDVGGVCPHQFDHGVPATSGVTSGPYRWRKSSMNRPARARSLSAASRPGSPWSG